MGDPENMPDDDLDEDPPTPEEPAPAARRRWLSMWLPSLVVLRQITLDISLLSLLKSFKISPVSLARRVKGRSLGSLVLLALLLLLVPGQGSGGGLAVAGQRGGGRRRGAGVRLQLVINFGAEK